VDRSHQRKERPDTTDRERSITRTFTTVWSQSNGLSDLRRRFDPSRVKRNSMAPAGGRKVRWSAVASWAGYRN
jgi:hypothetical protein